jgi:hypothetical protein
MISSDDAIYDVTWLQPADEQRIMDFLQGAVYYYCNNRQGEWFSAIEIAGSRNRDDWDNTPLGKLHNKHKQDGKTHDEAWRLAGQEVGKILNKVIKLDKRNFETEEAYPARKYRWIAG